MRIWICSLSMACLAATALGLLVCLPGCAPRAYRVETHTNDDGTVVTGMIGGEMALYRPEAYGSSYRAPGKHGPSAWCGIELQSSQDVNGRVTCHILLTIRSTGGEAMGSCLDMSRAVSLSLNIDGRPVLLWPEEDQSGHQETATWRYPVSTDILRELADGPEVVDLTLSNEGGTLVGACGTRIFEQFFEECVSPARRSTNGRQ